MQLFWAQILETCRSTDLGIWALRSTSQELAASLLLDAVADTVAHYFEINMFKTAVTAKFSMPAKTSAHMPKCTISFDLVHVICN